MQKSLSLFILAAAAVSLTSGCRTFGRRGGSDADGGAAEAKPAPSENTASAVGTVGSYKEFVIPDDGGDKTYAIESDGLRGSTGRHVSAPPPAPEPKLVVPAAPAGSGVYVVQDGDILGRIARKHGTTVKAIVEANGIKDASKIRVGQKLKIPAASAAAKTAPAKAHSGASAAKSATLPAKEGCTVYVIQNGDILGRIAKKHGVTMKSIREANGMTSDKIYAGRAIYIPSATSKPAAEAKPAAETRPAAEAKPAAETKSVTETKHAAPVSESDPAVVPPMPKDVLIQSLVEAKDAAVSAGESVSASVSEAAETVEPVEDFLSTLD